MQNKFKMSWRDLGGAFADGAILFPLLVGLTVQSHMDGTILLASAGFLYIAAGFLFRVPMAVQPLKSVAVAALALGATAQEISLSGLAVGVCCLLLSILPADKFADKVPKHLVHGLQMALGIILITQGIKWVIAEQLVYSQISIVAVSAVVIFLTARTDRPFMGWVAALGLIAGVYFALKGMGQVESGAPATTQTIRLDLIAALVLPQMVLTLANSVIGTKDVAMRYFKGKAEQVTVIRLLRSIGAGNIILSFFGGLPFCHGAGGVTAHVKGGAANWSMNIIIGGTLLAFAILSFVFSTPIIPSYPKPLMAVLLLSTGYFHLGLAQTSWQQNHLKFGLFVMTLAALATQSMLWTLAAGITVDILRWGRHALSR